jgi:dUTPase
LARRKKMKIKIKPVEGGKLPVYKTEGAVCADCYARLSATKRGEGGFGSTHL